MAQPYSDDQEYAPHQAGQVMDAYVTPSDGGSLAFGRPGDQADDQLGPERLFNILEEAVPRPDETLLLTLEEQQRRREVVEQTWDQVRRWLWAHESQEERAAAAFIRGQGDATPLHLMCRMSNPPTDLLSDLVEAAPEVVSWADSHGWLPLHHACAYGASPEIYQILTSAYPESKTIQDNQNRTPLHFYATRNSDNPAAMATTVGLLTDTGAAELPDRGGMLPMHYACAYGTSPAVLHVLAESYPESFVVKENNGRTPMHLAMVNAHRDASPGVIRFLLEGEGRKTVDMRDHEGNLPLHLLSLGLKGLNVDEPDKLNNVAECLKMYLAAEPFASPDFLTALQDLPDWLQDVAVVSPHVRHILNKKIVKRFPTSILMMDGYWLLIIIVCFEITTTSHIDALFSPDEDNVDNVASDKTGALIVLFLGASYFLCRELIQIISLWSLGSLSSWFLDTTNWLDMAVITLSFYYAILMTGYDGLGKEQFRSGVAFTKGVLWMAVIYFLKSTLVDFAVFVGGVFYVVQRLVAFLLAVGVILLAFAQMFFIVYRQRDVCVQNPADDQEFEAEFGFEPCRFPHCSFEESLLKVNATDNNCSLYQCTCLDSFSLFRLPLP
jgi:ankyrin repeat protein